MFKVLSKFKSMSLKLKLTASVVGFMFIIMLVIGFVTQTSIRNSLETLGKDKAKEIAIFLSKTSGSYITNYDVTALDRYVSDLQNNQHFEFAAFYDEKGSPISEITIKKDSLIGVSFERQDIVDSTGKKVGSIEIGHNNNWANAKVKEQQILSLVLYAVGILLLALGTWFILAWSVKDLVKVIVDLDEATEDSNQQSIQLNNVSKEVDVTGQSLSQVTQSIASSMEQASAMLKKTEESAVEGQKNSTEVQSIASTGLGQVRNLVEEMDSLKTISEKLKGMEGIIAGISEKTNVINDIVFKTQLLSFNASIEAARAGAHGKGFAVVAEEISNLAAISGNSATEITSLLASSSTQVKELVTQTESQIEKGRTVSDKTLNTFEEINSLVVKVSEGINNITDASAEQNIGIKETLAMVGTLGNTADEQTKLTSKITQIASSIMQQSENLDKVENSVSSIVLGHSKKAS